MLLTAYFDESGLGEDEQVCVVAGFLGNDAQWLSFANSWITAIKPRKSIHTKELRFTGSKAYRAKKLLAKLGPIPYQYNLTPIVGAVRHEDAHATFRTSGLRDIFSTPFMLGMQVAIHVSLKLLSPEDELLIVYERQDRYVEAMRFVEEQVFRLRQIDSRVRAITHVEKGDTVCTEPSDCLAYMTRENLVFGESDIFNMGKSIFGGKLEIDGHVWTRDQLASMVNEYVTKGIIIPSDFMRN